MSKRNQSREVDDAISQLAIAVMVRHGITAWLGIVSQVKASPEMTVGDLLKLVEALGVSDS